jgi:hypothetical protein
MINIGDKVWLFHYNLKTNHPYNKLNFRHLGPFWVIKQINDVAFRLELPPLIKIHHVFHISLLEPYKESSISCTFWISLPLIEIEGEEEFEVSEILDSRITQKNWSILFIGRDTTLVKGPGNLLPISIIFQKWFKNFIPNIQKNQVLRMYESNTSEPTLVSYLNFNMVRV